MAAILELVFDGKLTVHQLTEWLSSDDRQTPPSPLLQDFTRIKPEFVPYFLNFLRDQSAAILQGCRSANATPSKTPTVLKTQRSITFEEPKRKTSTPRSQGSADSKRVQLFAASPFEGENFTKEQSTHNNSSLNSTFTSNTAHFYDSPNRSSWSLNNSSSHVPYSPIASQENQGHGYSPKASTNHSPSPGGNYRKSNNRTGRATPGNDSWGRSTPTHNDSGGRQHADFHRSQHKNCLGDFLVTSSRKKKSPGGRGSGGKGRGDKKSWSSMSPSEAGGGRVFALANSEDFPTLGDKKAGPNESPSPAISLSVSGSAKKKTPSRRITPTAVENDTTPKKSTLIASQGSSVSTPSKPTSRRITPTAVSGSTPRVFNMTPDTSIKEEKSEAFSVPPSREVISMEEERKRLREARASLVLPSVQETTPQKTSRLREILARQITPTKLIAERMATVIEATPQLSEVTFRDRIYTLAEIYAYFIHEHLVPNVTVELYFVIQLLTTRGLDAELATEYLNLNDDDDICYFASVHNTVYFAVLVLEKQQRTLSLLDKGTLRLLVDNQRISDFSPSFKSDLSMMLARTNAKVRALPPSSPILGVSFQAETDNRKNFPNDRAFHTFKKQRDQFYELIREWHDNHMEAGWSMREVLSDRIRSIISPGLDLSNHIHFARLFQSQLILMCKGDRNLKVEGDGDNVSLLSELKLSNPDKFKRLQERFTTPLSVGSPCPQPYFPGCQEFFRDFIVVASSHLFNHHLTHTMAAKIQDLNGTQFSSREAGSDRENEIDPEELEALSTCLLTLRLLGKFLGFVTFLPYQSPEKLPDMMEATVISMRNKAPLAVDLVAVLSQGRGRGSLVTTVPWVVEFLSMMDPVAPRVDTFKQVLTLLVDIYRSVCLQFFTDRQTLNLFLVITCLGWLFELPIYPEGMFFRAFPFDQKKALVPMPPDSLDRMDLVDHSLFFSCCPYIGELKSLLMGFAVGSSNKGSSIRKITPLLTDREIPGTVSEKQVQSHLEESFFHNHPASMKRTVEFVADRVSSNYIKKFRAAYLPKLVHEGVLAVRDIKTEVASNGLDIRSKRRARQNLEDLCLDLATKAQVISSEEISSYACSKSGAILALTLPEDTSEGVLSVVTDIAGRHTRDKVIAWMNTHVTKAMFIRELSPDLEKFLKLLGGEAGGSEVSHHLDQTPTRHHAWTINPAPVDKAKQDGLDHDKHDETGGFPSQVLVDIKALHHDLVLGMFVGSDEDILQQMKKITWALENRQDVIPPVAKCMLRMTVDITYTLVIQCPGRWNEALEAYLMELWSRHKRYFQGFNHIFSNKHIYLLDITTDEELAWENLTGLVSNLLSHHLLTVPELEQQALKATGGDLPSRVLVRLAKLMSTLCLSHKLIEQDTSNSTHEYELILTSLQDRLQTAGCEDHPGATQLLHSALTKIQKFKKEKLLNNSEEERKEITEGHGEKECQKIPEGSEGVVLAENAKGLDICSQERSDTEEACTKLSDVEKDCQNPEEERSKCSCENLSLLERKQMDNLEGNNNSRKAEAGEACDLNAKCLTCRLHEDRNYGTRLDGNAEYPEKKASPKEQVYCDSSSVNPYENSEEFSHSAQTQVESQEGKL